MSYLAYLEWGTLKTPARPTKTATTTPAYIEAAIDTAGKHIADSVSKFQPDIEKGFSRLVDTIQKFELGSELRDLRKCLPYPVKYLKHSRTFHLTPEGHGDITGEYEIKNISDRKISKIILPIFGFGVKNYDKTTSYDELHELSIDGKKIDVPIDAIRKIKERSSPTLVSAGQETMLECCFHVPVDLQPNQTISVLLKFKNFGFAVPMYKFDFVGCRIYDITEKLIIMVVAPDKHTIRVLPEPQMQKGFRVLKLYFGRGATRRAN